MLVNIVGLGKVSLSIAKQLKDKIQFGYLVSRDFEKAMLVAKELNATPVTYNDNFKLKGIVLFGLNDSVLPKAKNLLFSKTEDIVAIHFSGFHPSTVFPFDWSPATMHPNCAVASDSALFKDVIFGLEGTEKGVIIAQKIVELLEGKYVIIPTDKKMIYHLAAVISSNFSIGLAYISSILYKEIGIEDEISEKIISQLLKTVSENIEKLGISNALTGPIKRGDWDVVRNERSVFLDFVRKKNICCETLYDDFVKLLSTILEIKEE
ncbi:MAG: DUF2520 domain-containing protein [Fervidobacterium sp.]